jgi:hypothetical protein
LKYAQKSSTSAVALRVSSVVFLDFFDLHPKEKAEKNTTHESASAGNLNLLKVDLLFPHIIVCSITIQIARDAASL